MQKLRDVYKDGHLISLTKGVGWSTNFFLNDEPEHSRGGEGRDGTVRYVDRANDERTCKTDIVIDSTGVSVRNAGGLAIRAVLLSRVS